jgi:hypothetical protein
LNLFNFKDNWNLVKPFLKDEYVQQQLDYGMNLAMQWRKEDVRERMGLSEKEFEKKLKENPSWGKQFVWEHGTAPYLKTKSDYWLDRPKPRKNSYQWYQCKHECHGIAYFCKALGEKIFPNLVWAIAEGEYHSVAIGVNDNNDIIEVFDILNFEDMTAEEIIEFAMKTE